MQKIEDIEENDLNKEIIMMGLHQEDGISEATSEKHLNKIFPKFLILLTQIPNSSNQIFKFLRGLGFYFDS